MSLQKLIEKMRARDGQDFDGEVHLTSKEAKQICDILIMFQGAVKSGVGLEPIAGLEPRKFSEALNQADQICKE